MPSNGITPKPTTAPIADSFQGFTINGKPIARTVTQSKPPPCIHDEYSDSAGAADMQVLRNLQGTQNLNGPPKPRGRR